MDAPSDVKIRKSHTNDDEAEAVIQSTDDADETVIFQNDCR